MKTFFTVSDLNFLNDGENDSLSFIPTPDIKNKFSDKDLLRRIFTENIAVVPEPPTYSEVIQKLIDADAQSVDDVAKILSLYNPADFSDIIQKLIDANAQTVTDVRRLTQSYPYENSSVIFDRYFNNWSKISTGTITQTASGNWDLNKAGLQLANIFEGFTIVDYTIRIIFTITVAQNFWVLQLFNAVSTTSTATPILGINYYNSKFRIGLRTANNGNLIYGTDTTYNHTVPANQEVDLSIVIKNNSAEIIMDGKTVNELKNVTIPTYKYLRINANNAGTSPTTWNINLNELTIRHSVNILSQIKKE